MHLRLDGTWQVCDVPTCELLHHVEGLSVEEAQQLPANFIDQLLESSDPATYDDGGGRLEWRDEQKRLHRDYDRPALIAADGMQAWYQDGLPHRDGDRPALIRPNGLVEWWHEGQKHRDGGRPAVMAAGSTHVEYWIHGKLIGTASNGSRS